MVKKIPMRMCVACRMMGPKNSLLRVVRTETGDAVLDRTGKRNGRGAYLCAKSACLERAIKTRALERALEISLSEETVRALREEMERAGTTV